MRECTNCGKEVEYISNQERDKSARIIITPDILCDRCYNPIRKKLYKEAEAQPAKRRKWMEENFHTVQLFSLHYLPDVRIHKYFNLITSEVVIGTGPFVEFGAQLADLFGQRASGFEDKLLAGKSAAMKRIQCRALELGANAVLGIDIDYNVIGTNMIMIVVSGTPVILEKTGDNSP